MRGRGFRWLAAACMLLAAVPVCAAIRGSVSMRLDRPMLIGGQRIEAGECQFQWQSERGDCCVRFQVNGRTIECRGKLTEHESKVDSTTFIIYPGDNGLGVVREIRLPGKNFAVLFE